MELNYSYSQLLVPLTRRGYYAMDFQVSVLIIPFGLLDDCCSLQSLLIFYETNEDTIENILAFVLIVS